MELFDFIVIGGEIVGLTTALEIRKRHPNESIAIFEKELEIGQHASGRNRRSSYTIDTTDSMLA